MKSSLNPSLSRLVIFLALSMGLQAPLAKADEFMLAAAASLQDALTELKAGIESEVPGITLRVTTGASGVLGQQINQGAPIDLFLSAAEKPVRELEKAGQLTPATSLALLSNDLVLIAPKTTFIGSIADLKNPKIKRIALGEPRTVPAGDYAMQTLSSFKLDKDLSHKFVYAKDVRQVLNYVERGEVDAGFVYKSDWISAAGKNVTLVEQAPESSHRPIRYFAAVVATSKNQDKAKKMVTYLAGPKAAVIWRKYGFQPLSPIATVSRAKAKASAPH